MTVSVRIESVRPYSGPTWNYGAHVMLGENVKGIARLVSNEQVGATVRCQVIQVDHEGRRVELTEAVNDAEKTTHMT
jgi:hypothetical protein